jgi:glycine/D-amino acid oxidase-like deaminating enzyme
MASAGRSTREQQWEQTSFYELWSLANSVPAAGIHVQDIVLYTREKDMDKPSDIPGAQRSLLSDNPWFENFIQGFRKLEAHELPKGVASGTTFKSVCINTAVYLPWLVSMLLAEGVTIKRAVLTHICEAKDLHCGIAGDKAPVVVVVNCTGINARKLGGVMDETVVPVRGQTVVVRNTAPSMFTISGSDGGPDECTYIMTRAAGKHTSYIIFRFQNDR